MSAQPISETPDHETWDEVEYSLEVANFLDALERVVARLFGAPDQLNDNDDDPSTIPEEA